MIYFKIHSKSILSDTIRMLEARRDVSKANELRFGGVFLAAYEHMRKKVTPGSMQIDQDELAEIIQHVKYLCMFTDLTPQMYVPYKPTAYDHTLTGLEFILKTMKKQNILYAYCTNTYQLPYQGDPTDVQET